MWAGWDGSHVEYLALTHDYVIDQTLNVKLRDANRDKVLVGETDEILVEETDDWSGAMQRPFKL